MSCYHLGLSYNMDQVMGCGGSKSTTVVATTPAQQFQQHFQPGEPPAQHWSQSEPIQQWPPQQSPTPAESAAETGFTSGHDGSPLTKEDILRHNSNAENHDKSFWHPWKGQVYDALALYRHFKPSIEAHEDSYNFSCYTLEADNKLILPNLPFCGIKKAERDQALKWFHVGPLVQLSEEDRQAKLKADVELVRLIFSPQFEENPPGWEPDEHEVLVRNICDRELRKLECNTHHNYNDPNDVTFPLPRGVDCDDLREWLRQWEEFDTELPKDGAWQMSDVGEHLNTQDQHELFAAHVRQWKEEWECFDFSIEGEAGWEVMEQDLVKNDETTEEQEAILESRSCRTDLEDEDRMKRRREALAAYFIEKYEWDTGKVEPFLQWAQLLKENAEKVEKLSTTVL